MYKLALSLLAATLLVLAGCEQVEGSGNPETHTVEIDAPIESVALSIGKAELDIVRGDQNTLVITIDDNLYKLLEIDTDDNKLDIGIKNNHFFTRSSPISLVLTLENPDTIEALSIAGSGTINADSLNPESMDLDLAGSGDMLLPNLTTGTLTVDITGSGDILTTGHAEKQSINIAGSGRYKAMDLTCSRASVNIAGSGDIDINVSQKLTVSIAGSGDIRLKGNPEISSSIMGSGDIVHVQTNNI